MTLFPYRPGRTSIARDLALWLAVGCLAVTAPVAFWGYRAVINRAETELERETDMLCSKLINTLGRHVWNIDDTAIEAYFKAYHMPENLVYVRICTQYGDPIYNFRVSSERRVKTFRHTIVNGNEIVGDMEVGVSLAGIKAYRRYMALLILGMAALMTIAIGILSAVLIRLLLGRGLNRLIRHLRVIAAGDYNTRISTHRYREVDAINAEVNLMTDRIADGTAALHAEIEVRRRAELELQQMKDRLEEIVERRTVQIREAHEDLLRESAERKRVQREILDICNSEQRRIGQDLHDSVCQELAGIAYLAGWLERNLSAKGYPDAEQARQIASLLRESVSRIRRVARGLNPVGLEADGLIHVLKETAEDAGKFFHAECRVACAGNGIVQNAAAAVHLFYITREAIHNAIRHGKARMIEIRLDTENETGSLTIRDNGVGFTPSLQTDTGMGLHTMKYRAELIGGKLDIQSAVNSGTVVTVTFDNSPAAR